MKQGYAAILVSIINYGFNVANRRILPSDQFPHKETSIFPGLQGEESYIRSENNHPSREVYKDLIKILEKIGINKEKQEDQDKSDSKFDESKEKKEKATSKNEKIKENKYQALIDLLKKDLSKDEPATEEKEKEREEVEVGKWKTPEEMIEYVFSLLDPPDVVTVCQEITEKTIRTMHPVDQKKQQDEKSVAFPSPGYEKLHNPGNSTSFRAIMQERVGVVKEIDEKLKKEKATLAASETGEEKLSIIPYVSDSGYPCVIFDMRPLAALCGLTLSSDSDHSSNSNDDEKFKEVISLVMSYFCGLVNFYSMQRYGENFVWVQTQSSFGSLRPTLAETGKSFRFSPGLVPLDFSEIMTEAYTFLILSLKKKESINQLKATFGLGEEKSSPHKSKEEEQLPIDSVRIGDMPSDSSEEKAQSVGERFFSEDRTWAQENAQLRVLSLMKKNADSKPENIFQKYLLGLKENPLILKDKLSQSSGELKVLQERKENFSSAITLEQGKKYFPASASKTLISLSEDLACLAIKRLTKFRGKYSLSGLEKTLMIEMREAIHFAHQADGDYSKVTSAIETLSRLLKLDYELEIYYLRELRIRYPQEKKFQKGDRSKSEDSTTSEESTASEGTFETRSGISASTIGIEELHGAASLVFYVEDLYYEYTSDLAKEIIRVYKGSKNNTVGGTSDSDHDESRSLQWEKKAELKESEKIKGKEEKSLTIDFIDIAVFPSKAAESQDNKSTPWKGDWKDISPGIRKEILLVDITSGTQEDLDRLYDNFEKSAPNENPLLLLTFASNNKFGMMGVDLVSMGEIRCYFKPTTELERQKKVLSVVKALKKRFQSETETSIAARAYRRVIYDVGQRRTLRHKILPKMNEKRLIVDDLNLFFKREVEPIITKMIVLCPQGTDPDDIPNKIHGEIKKLAQLMSGLQTQIISEKWDSVKDFIAVHITETLKRETDTQTSDAILKQLERQFYPTSTTRTSVPLRAFEVLVDPVPIGDDAKRSEESEQKGSIVTSQGDDRAPTALSVQNEADSVETRRAEESSPSLPKDSFLAKIPERPTAKTREKSYTETTMSLSGSVVRQKTSVVNSRAFFKPVSVDPFLRRQGEYTTLLRGIGEQLEKLRGAITERRKLLATTTVEDQRKKHEEAIKKYELNCKDYQAILKEAESATAKLDILLTHSSPDSFGTR